MSGIMDTERVISFFLNYIIIYQRTRGVKTTIMTTCNFTIIFYNGFTLKDGIMDTRLLIYFASASIINLNISSFILVHLLHFQKGNTDIIILSHVVVKSNYLEIQNCISYNMCHLVYNNMYNELYKYVNIP